MSGFFGIFRNDGTEVSDQLLQAVADVLARRGPDGTHIWKRGGLGCCFAFMRTDRDRQATTQPVTLDDKTFLLGDVRLDGRPELIEQLEREGQYPRARCTDEELLLYAWRCWGEECLPHLLGDFSFAVWDAGGKGITCARDLVGARPFFYAQFASGFCFGNTLQALQKLPEISRELDELFIGDFLLNGFCADPTRSAFRDIRRLPPAHRLTVSHAQLTISRFLKLPVEEPLRLQRPQEYCENFRDLLVRSVRDRLPQDAASFYLSGGLDSASVCAVAVHIAKESAQPPDLKAFTVSWQRLIHDEEPDFAQITAQHLGLTHEILGDTDCLPWAMQAPNVQAAPEPICDPFFARAVEDLQKISNHARVVLSGDAGDDVLTGQSWPYLTHLAEGGEWKQIARAFGGFFLTRGRIPPLRGGFRGKVRRLFHKGQSSADYPAWLDRDFEIRVGLRQRWGQPSHPSVNDSVGEHPIHPSGYATLHSGRWATVLEEEDAGFTGVNLEPRAPFLDLRVLRFLFRVPPVPWCVDKFLLREVMKPSLPEEIQRRPKSPLAEDPLDASIRLEKWRPSVPARPPAVIHQFVNWQNWTETLRNSKGSLTAVHVRSFALLRWLKDIENG